MLLIAMSCSLAIVDKKQNQARTFHSVIAAKSSLIGVGSSLKKTSS